VQVVERVAPGERTKHAPLLEIAQVLVLDDGIHRAQIAGRVVPRPQRVEIGQPGFAAEIVLGEDARHVRRHVARFRAGDDDGRARGQVGGKRPAQTLHERAHLALGQHGQFSGQRHVLTGQGKHAGSSHHAEVTMERRRRRSQSQI
jgi:hypothetical protein